MGSTPTATRNSLGVLVVSTARGLLEGVDDSPFVHRSRWSGQAQSHHPYRVETHQPVAYLERGARRKTGAWQPRPGRRRRGGPGRAPAHQGEPGCSAPQGRCPVNERRPLDRERLRPGLRGHARAASGRVPRREGTSRPGPRVTGLGLRPSTADGSEARSQVAPPTRHRELRTCR